MLTPVPSVRAATLSLDINKVRLIPESSESERVERKKNARKAPNVSPQTSALGLSALNYDRGRPVAIKYIQAHRPATNFSGVSTARHIAVRQRCWL